MSLVDEIFQVAKKCSALAAQMCLEFKHGVDSQSLKNDKSWVTEADKKIEDKLREIILKNFPNHSILGEENGGAIDANPDAFTWILDPIDGTFSFVHNVPFYSSLIAVLKGNTPIIGIASLPAMNITMSAMRGGGVYINDKKYERSRLVGSPNIEIVATADPYRFYLQQKDDLIKTLYGDGYKARTYPDALGYYMLLQGSVRAFIDPKVEIWDVAPFHVIMPEAGYAIHDWSGNKDLQKGTSICYPLNEDGSPLHCKDVLELALRSA